LLQFDNEWTKADEMAVHSLHDGWVGVDRGMLIHISFYVLAAVLSLCEEVDRAAATIYGEVGWLEARWVGSVVVVGPAQSNNKQREMNFVDFAVAVRYQNTAA
jgi:hypothetical protein